MFVYALLLLTTFACNSKCANILGVFNIPSISHEIVFQPIWKELSLRGHNVTVITPNPLKDPSLVNLTEIDLSVMYHYFEDTKSQMSQSMNHWKTLNLMIGLVEWNLEKLLQHHQVAALINDNNTEFDVVLAEAIMPAVYVFAAKFKCPLIGVSSLGTFNVGHQTAGNPNHPILYPDMTTTFARYMTFSDKVEAVMFDLWQRYVYTYQIFPLANTIVKKHFGEDTPKIEDIAKNMSMLFLNTNPILHGVRPYGPNVIQMGKMHFKPKRPLPDDLKAFMDNSKRGLIYFSLGTNIKCKYLEKNKLKLISEIFSELPYDILWKFEDEMLNGKPSNVKVSKWFPQQDLLDHPNLKLFITQAGLQSFEEGVFYEVPMLAIPFVADQYGNAARIEKLEIGLQLQYSTLTKENFRESIQNILQNPKYKENILRVSALFKDQPTNGLERAIWWIEYVIRNKGAPHFKNPVVDMQWHQFLLLDVFAFILCILLGAFSVIYAIVKFVIKRYKWLQIKEMKKL